MRRALEKVGFATVPRAEGIPCTFQEGEAPGAEAFWRLWNTIIAHARRRTAAGHIDVVEIHRIMGWDQ
jgi:hypothetical protein